MAGKRNNKDKRELILQAALKVFAQKGFFHSRVNEIANRAGVADGTIYLYFNNKDDILISLFEEEMQNYINHVEAALARVDHPLDKINELIRTHLAMVDSNPDAADIMQVEVRQSAKFMKEYRNEKFAYYLGIMVRIIDEGQGQGLIRSDVRPEAAARILFGALDEMARYRVLSTKKKFKLEEATKQIGDIFIAGLAVEQN